MINKEIYAEYVNGVDKWYFIGTTDGPNRIINTTKVLNTGDSEYGYINHLTPPYKTKEYLCEAMSILDSPCVECGGVISANYDKGLKAQLIERNMCFSCSLWFDRIEACKENRVMIVNHQMYSIIDENEKGSFRGFGVARFHFMKYGIDYVSTNVWFGGNIPQHFRERIPNNAIIVRGNAPFDKINY